MALCLKYQTIFAYDNVKILSDNRLCKDPDTTWRDERKVRLSETPQSDPKPSSYANKFSRTVNTSLTKFRRVHTLSLSGEKRNAVTPKNPSNTWDCQCSGTTHSTSNSLAQPRVNTYLTVWAGRDRTHAASQSEHRLYNFLLNIPNIYDKCYLRERRETQNAKLV